jgi:hypothetical protein
MYTESNSGSTTFTVLRGTFRTSLESWEEVCHESKFTGDQPLNTASLGDQAQLQGKLS